MFIDQMTLFILAEMAVVYVVITAFLFYRQRLYHVLVAILKEMRWEKLRRQQEKEQEVAALRAQNRQLTLDNKAAAAAVDSAGKTIPEQLRQHLNTLEAEAKANGNDLRRTPEPDEPAHIHWLRRKVLGLEQKLLAGEIDEEEWADQAHQLLKDSGLEPSSEARKEGADTSLNKDQLTADLNQYKSQYAAARDRVRLLEQELTGLKSINTATPSSFDRPEKGTYADELYKLKCDKYDMQETINQLSLKLQQIDPEGDEFASQQAELINALNQYVKDSDVSVNLLEKELDAVNHDNTELENEVHSLKNRLKDLQVRGPKAVNPDHVKKLNANASSQSESVANLRNTLDQLRSGADPEQALQVQDDEISRLELLVRDSESCVSMLEMELQQAQQALEELNAHAAGEQQEGTVQDEQEAPADERQKHKQSEDFEIISAQIQLSLDTLRNLVDDLREGADSEEVLPAQEKEINHLQAMLTSTEALVAELDARTDQVNAQDTRAESNEDIEEMESLVKQFMSDSQTMLQRIKELEQNQRDADKAETLASS
jgi:chromosome segregation ATPase